MNKLAITVALISTLFAFIFLTVNVDTKDVGGITGTFVVKPGTPNEHVDQARSAIRIAGVGWICIGVLSLAWAIRSSRKWSMFPPINRPPRRSLLFFAGILVFSLGIVGGIVFVTIVGMDSPEFQNYFVYFIGMYMAGITLGLLGK